MSVIDHNPAYVIRIAKDCTSLTFTQFLPLQYSTVFNSKQHTCEYSHYIFSADAHESILFVIECDLCSFLKITSV